MIAAALLASSFDVLPPSPVPGGDPAVFVLAAFLFGGGLLQFIGAFRARRGEFRTTIGRQLSGAFGPRGAVAVLVGLGVFLVAASVALVAFTRPEPRSHRPFPPPPPPSAAASAPAPSPS